jgi:uncharacterized integral membrane protein
VRIVYWVVTGLVALFLVIFAISNRESVGVTFWPLPVYFQAPLYMVVLLFTLVGFLFGEIVAWIGGRRWRRDARVRRRRVEALERELAVTQAQLRPAAAPPVAPGTRLAVTGTARD